MYIFLSLPANFTTIDLLVSIPLSKIRTRNIKSNTFVVKLAEESYFIRFL